VAENCGIITLRDGGGCEDSKYQPEVYELKLSLDVNGKILGRLFRFAACFQLRLFHT
jgi:hypothetical protein